jgi:hypothetical protein
MKRIAATALLAMGLLHVSAAAQDERIHGRGDRGRAVERF